MGYLGSSIDDYYAFQLVDEAIRQVNNNDAGDWLKLKQSVKKLIQIIEKKENKINGKPNIRRN
jgi:hypothetical protein